MQSTRTAARHVIGSYVSSLQSQIVDLILHIQNVEYGVNISLDEQPDLLDIEACYFGSGGGFWVAQDNAGRVVGTIALQRYEKNVAVLKKFFVSEAFRGSATGCAMDLFTTLIAFASAQGIETIVLDTPALAVRSHAFYKRNGFRQIDADELPVEYEYVQRNSLLFRLDLPVAGAKGHVGESMRRLV